MRLKTFVTGRKEEYLQVGGGAFRVSSINLPPLSGEYISFLPLRQLFHLYNPLHIFFLRFFLPTLPSSPLQHILFSNSSSSSQLTYFLLSFRVLFPLQSSLPLSISYSGFPDVSLLPSLIVFLSFLFPQMSHSLAGWGEPNSDDCAESL
jgi:hypothetical protein